MHNSIISNSDPQNNGPIKQDTIVIEQAPQSESRNNIDVNKQSAPGQLGTFLLQQQALLEKFDKLIEKTDKGKKKDFWDVVSSLSGMFTLCSSIVIAWLGVQFTDVYKKQETQVAKAQTVEKFLPHLTSNNESSIRGALLAVYALQDDELSARLAASYVNDSSIDVCEIILKDAKGESHNRLTDALVNAYYKRASAAYWNYSLPIEQVLDDYNKILNHRKDDYILAKWGPYYLATIYTNRANCYVEQKNYVKADTDFDRAFQIVPDFWYTYMYKATMYSNKKDFNTALQYHNKSIEQVEKGFYYGEVFTRRGETYEKMGDIEKAISDFNKSVVTEPYTDWIYERRGLFYERQNKGDKAVQDFMEVINITNNEDKRFWAKQSIRRINPTYLQNTENKLGAQIDGQNRVSTLTPPKPAKSTGSRRPTQNTKPINKRNSAKK